MRDGELLTTTPLFQGSTVAEIEGMLGCLGMHERMYSAGERIHRMGDRIREVGLVLEGSVRIESVDVWGNVSVMGMRGPGQIFGEAYAAIPDEPLMVDVVAAEGCRIMLLTVSKVLTTCSRACPNHARASANLTAIIARQNLALSRRIFHVAPKTIRGKVLAYLSDQAERADSREFDIPYNRQQLADYLGVDRSALSAELSDAAAASAGHYMAVIKFVDAESGDVVASDAVWVRGEVAYTTPGTIYRSAGSASDVAQYDRAAGEPAVLALSAARDGVTTGARTVEVRYGLAEPGQGAHAAFSLIDGSKRAGDAARTLGTFEGELPPAEFADADGSEFELVGEPSDYGPLASGMADAYYLPKGWSGARDAYAVTVSYVDWSTREEIGSEEFSSSPDDLAGIVLEPPAQFAEGGATWLRLDGQESIEHSYWSHIDRYTVYYRDRSKPVESAPTITRIRVVYRDGGTTYVDNGTTNAGTAAAGTTANAGMTGTNANANAGAGADAAAPADERLDSGRSYDVAQGGGAAQQATGQDGRDAAQQRIEDAENPLAGGTSDPVGPAGQQPAEGLPLPAVIGMVVAAVAVIAIVAALLARRKRDA